MSNFFLNEAIPVTEQDWSDDVQPVVSVFNWSYNHVNFIRQSIESILEQKTTFNIEIIIHDDASNDGTIEIIREYESKYPRLFRNIIQKENQWSQGKSVMNPLFKAPRGKYIALAHGDDYWTDPYKLQKQVDFLEKHQDYLIIGTNAKYDAINDLNINNKSIRNQNESISFEIEDFLDHNNLLTCTVLFRNVGFDDFNNVLKFPYGDWFLYVFILHKTKKKAIEIPEVTASYRIHSGGVFSGNSSINNYWNHILQVYNIYRFLDLENYNYFKSSIINYYFHLLYSCNSYKKLNYTIKLLFLLKLKFPFWGITKRIYYIVNKNNFMTNNDSH